MRLQIGTDVRALREIHDAQFPGESTPPGAKGIVIAVNPRGIPLVVFDSGYASDVYDNDVEIIVRKEA